MYNVNPHSGCIYIIKSPFKSMSIVVQLFDYGHVL